MNNFGKAIQTALACIAFAAFGLGLGGCDSNDGSAETVGEKIDESIEEVGEAVEEAGEEIQESAR